MCCIPSSRTAHYETWNQAGQEELPWYKANKVATVAISFFTGISVIGIAWGFYELYSAASSYDSNLLKKGLIILGSSTASAVACTFAWTCACTHNVNRPAPQSQIV